MQKYMPHELHNTYHAAHGDRFFKRSPQPQAVPSIGWAMNFERKQVMVLWAPKRNLICFCQFRHLTVWKFTVRKIQRCVWPAFVDSAFSKAGKETTKAAQGTIRRVLLTCHLKLWTPLKYCVGMLFRKKDKDLLCDALSSFEHCVLPFDKGSDVT